MPERRDGTHPKVIVDTDLLGRMHVRLVLSALCEHTGRQMVIGPKAQSEVGRVLDRIGAQKQRVAETHEYYEIWREEMEKEGVTGSVSRHDLLRHRYRHPEIHAWLEKTWEKLKGDDTDLDHVAEGITCAAEAVLTGNMTSIDGERLKDEARRAGYEIPRVWKCDDCLAHFARVAGREGRAKETLEDAVLGDCEGHTDFMKMWRNLLPALAHSFPETTKRIGEDQGSWTHEAYRERQQGLPAAHVTRRVIEKTLLDR